MPRHLLPIIIGLVALFTSLGAQDSQAQSRAKYIGTLFHEVAHDATHAHDKTWGMTMQHLFERLLVNAEFA